MNQKSQSSILNAWENLERALKKDYSDSLTLVSRPQTSKTSKLMREYSSQQQLRPLTALTRPSTAITLKKELEQSTIRKVLTIKVSQRNFKKFGFDNIHIAKRDESPVQNVPTQIHSLDAEQIIDLYSTKCIDRGLLYQPEHALQFVEKFKKQCENQLFICEDNMLGVATSQKIKDLLMDNRHFMQLKLARNNIGDEGLQIITELLAVNKNILHLDVSSNNITSQGAYDFFTALQDIHSVVSVDFSSKDGLNRNKVSVKGCEPLEMLLKYNHPLEFLSLRGTAIQQCGFECILSGLSTNSTLQYLNVSYNDLNAESCNYMSNHLIKSQLFELDISNNPLGNTGMDHFATLFEKDTFQLKSLNLSGCNIKSLGILKLFTCLAKNRSLEKLILDDNQLQGNGFNQIENVLISRCPLQYLSLAKCHISSTGADYIGNGVERNKILKTLILRDNRLTDVGAECIFKGPYFEKLDLKRCNITDKCVAALSAMIKASTSLAQLCLADNDFHDSSGIVLSEAIRGNASLILVDITENPLGYKYIDEIAKVVQDNRSKQEQNKIPSFLKEVQKLKDYTKQKTKLDQEDKDIKQRKQISQANFTKAQEEKDKTRQEQINKTLNLEQELQTIIQKAKQMDQDKNKYEIESMHQIIKFDDQYNQFLQEISITNQNIIRLEKEIRGQKESKQMKKQHNEQRLDLLRRQDAVEQRTLDRATIDHRQLEERVRLLREGPTSRRKK